MTLTTNERLANLERMGAALHLKVDSLLRAANLEIYMEIEQMADFASLIAQITKLDGRVKSTNAFVVGLQKQISDLAVGMNDEEDQAKIEALAADVGTLIDKLPQAIAAGASMGGIDA